MYGMISITEVVMYGMISITEVVMYGMISITEVVMNGMISITEVVMYGMISITEVVMYGMISITEVVMYVMIFIGRYLQHFFSTVFIDSGCAQSSLSDVMLTPNLERLLNWVYSVNLPSLLKTTWPSARHTWYGVGYTQPHFTICCHSSRKPATKRSYFFSVMNSL